MAGGDDGVAVQRNIVLKDDGSISQDGYRLGLATKHSGFMMRLFTKYSKSNARLVKGGDTVRLRHLEYNMFLRGQYDLLRRSPTKQISTNTSGKCLQTLSSATDRKKSLQK